MTASFRHRTSAHGQEYRCHDLDDVWLGPCAVLGALVADEVMMELWDKGAFDAVDEDDLPQIARAEFFRVRERARAHGARNVWQLCLEHIPCRNAN